MGLLGENKPPSSSAYFAVAIASMSHSSICGVILTTFTSIHKRHSKMRQHFHVCHLPQFHTPSHVHCNPSMTGMKAGNGNFLSPTEPKTCEHGHQFNRVDPVSNGWISQKGIVIKGISHNQRSTENSLLPPNNWPMQTEERI